MLTPQITFYKIGRKRKGQRAMKLSHKFYAVVATCAILLLVLSGCTRYERKVVPFKMPSSLPNATWAAGANIAAKAFDNSEEAKSAFGFDIIGSGVLPVQVIFDNQGPHPLEIIAQKTYLVDSDDNLWPILDASLAYDRISKKTEYGEVVPESVKPGLLGGAAGAIVGAAIGIVTGENVGEAAGKGAAVGSAAGLIIGGAKGASDEEVPSQIAEDLQNRTLESKPVPARDIAQGFIFFPGEAKSARELRLTIRETDTESEHTLILNF
jgi:hypothetical protein